MRHIVKNDIKLWYSPLQKKYYCGEQQYCCSCRKKLYPTFIYARHVLRKETFIKLYCLNCVKKIEKIGIMRNIIIVQAKSSPIDSNPVIWGIPRLQDTHNSTFDIHKLTGVDKDNTKFAGRGIEFKGLQIGKNLSELEENKVLSKRQAIKFLEAVQNSMPVIEETKKEAVQIEE